MNNIYYPNGTNLMNGDQNFNRNLPNNVLNNKEIMNNSYKTISFDDIIRNNIGKLATIYMSFPSSSDGNDKNFTGVIEDCGQDYFVISTASDGKWLLLLFKYLDYIIFDEQINHN